MNRADIARLALQEAQTHSFEKVSMQDLANKAGIKKASFYYHFPSKQAVAIGALEIAQTTLQDYFQYYEQRSPKSQIDAYIKLFSKHMNPIHNLCPGAGFISAWSSQSAELHKAVQMLYRIHYEYLVDVIEKGIEHDTLSPVVPSREAAQSIFCMLQGGLLAARVNHSTEIFSGLSNTIENLLCPTERQEGESA
jgi:TetR/AcrR family transcriptional repressor of nem operon